MYDFDKINRPDSQFKLKVHLTVVSPTIDLYQKESISIIYYYEKLF